MLHSLNPDRLKKIIGVFDREYGDIPGLDVPPLYGVPVWDMPYIIGDEKPEDWSPWLELVGYASFMEHEIKGLPDFVNVVRAPEPGMIRRCSLWVEQSYIPISKVAVYRVNEELFLKEVARRLNVGVTKNTRVLLKNHVWELGAVSLGAGVSFPVYLVRRLHQARDAIIESLSKHNVHGLVLLTGKKNPVHQKWPPGIEVQRLWDVIAGDGLRFDVSQPMLNTGVSIVVNTPVVVRSAKVENTVTQTTSKIDVETKRSSFDEIKNERGETIVAYDWNNHVLSIPGKPDWYLEGETRQAAIVEYLFEKAKSGVWEVKHKDIMFQTEPSYGGSRHITNVFRNNRTWREFILIFGRGKWGFDVVHG